MTGIYSLPSAVSSVSGPRRWSSRDRCSLPQSSPVCAV